MDARVDKMPAGWRSERGEASLADVHRSIAVRNSGPGWRRAAAFVGPGYLVAVGYMDPGNWATSLAGGSKFGYTLLVVALSPTSWRSSCSRCAPGSPSPPAAIWPRPAATPSRKPCRLAALAPRRDRIIATDIAEVIGTAIGLNLLFGIPLEIGVVITALDVFLILCLQRLGFRWIEAFITLLGVIAPASRCRSRWPIRIGGR
jgi:manganese transport protein